MEGRIVEVEVDMETGAVSLLRFFAAHDVGKAVNLGGVAAAPDFTARMVAEEFNEAQRAALARDGQVAITSEYDTRPYVITQALIDDGNENLLLGGAIALTCPVRLLHGMKDDAVPWRTSMKIMDALAGADVTTTLVKNGDHRLSEPDDIERLLASVGELLDREQD